MSKKKRRKLCRVILMFRLFDGNYTLYFEKWMKNCFVK